MTAAPRRADVLPLSLPPRGLSRTEAAAYIGVSPTLFDKMVDDGRMPRPKQVSARSWVEVDRGVEPPRCAVMAVGAIKVGAVT